MRIYCLWRKNKTRKDYAVFLDEKKGQRNSDVVISGYDWGGGGGG